MRKFSQRTCHPAPQAGTKHEPTGAAPDWPGPGQSSVEVGKSEHNQAQAAFSFLFQVLINLQKETRAAKGLSIFPSCQPCKHSAVLPSHSDTFPTQSRAISLPCCFHMPDSSICNEFCDEKSKKPDLTSCLFHQRRQQNGEHVCALPWRPQHLLL